MSRKRNGKLRKLSEDERAKREARNNRRGRDKDVKAWEKAHIVKPKPKPFLTKEQAKGKQSRAAEAMAEALVEAVPAIEDAKRG